MESRAKISGHPAHPILAALPTGLFATAVVFDRLHLFSGSRQMAGGAYRMMAAGPINPVNGLALI